MPICLRLLTQLIRLAASRAACTAGKSSAINTAMIAMTTSSSIRVNPLLSRDGGRGASGAELSAGTGEEGPLRPLRHAVLRRQSASSPPGCSWPEHRTELDGQVFWLSARYGPGPPSRLVAVARMSGGLADYSGGPATDSNRLPYSPPGLAGGGTCRARSLESFAESVSMAGKVSITPARYAALSQNVLRTPRQTRHRQSRPGMPRPAPLEEVCQLLHVLELHERERGRRDHEHWAISRALLGMW